MGGWNRKRKEKRRRKKEEAARRAQLANQPVSIDSTKIDAPAMGSQGIMVQKQGTNEPIPVIYGKTRTGGAQVFIKAEGATAADNLKNLVLKLEPNSDIEIINFDN